jgi:RimJ/RimL family protein N-acetyltransferase
MHESQPIANIVGEKITLGPLSKDVLPTITRWINDFQALRTLGAGMPGPSSLENEEEWYASAISRTAGVTFLIRERSSHLPVGTTSLHTIDFRNRATTFGILMGEHTARGQGYGTEAASLMLDYAFNALGLHSVSLTVAEFNLAGRAAYSKAGFRECGRLRERLWLAGRMWDQIHMDCLATEFTSPVLAAVFAPDTPR